MTASAPAALAVLRAPAAAAPPPRLRVLLVDDQPLVRAGLRGLLAGTADLELAGEASGADAVATALELRPDVVVCGLARPDGERMAALGRIRALLPATRVLVLGGPEDDAGLLGAVRAGASGFALAGAGEDALLGAIRAVGRGEATFGAHVADRLLAALAGDGDLEPFPQLRPRERDVLALLGAGRSTGEIARELELSPKTVRNHVAEVCAKLCVADRFQAALRAREAGLTPALARARRAPRSGRAH